MTVDPHHADQQAATGAPALADLLRSLPGGPGVADRVMAELADVQVAHEELRVAENEMRWIVGELGTAFASIRLGA